MGKRQGERGKWPGAGEGEVLFFKRTLTTASA